MVYDLYDIVRSDVIRNYIKLKVWNFYSMRYFYGGMIVMTNPDDLLEKLSYSGLMDEIQKKYSSEQL